jgi:hypothetical protein
VLLTHTQHEQAGEWGQRPPTPVGIPCVPTDAATDAAPIDSSLTKKQTLVSGALFFQLKINLFSFATFEKKYQHLEHHSAN